MLQKSFTVETFKQHISRNYTQSQKRKTQRNSARELAEKSGDFKLWLKKIEFRGVCRRADQFGPKHENISSELNQPKIDEKWQKTRNALTNDAATATATTTEEREKSQFCVCVKNNSRRIKKREKNRATKRADNVDFGGILSFYSLSVTVCLFMLFCRKRTLLVCTADVAKMCVCVCAMLHSLLICLAYKTV